MKRIAPLAAALAGLLVLLTALTLVPRLMAVSASRTDDLHRLLDEGCETAGDAPCWYGIILSTTSHDESLYRLRNHPWIDNASIFTQAVPEMVSWRWNRTAPSFLTNRLPNHMMPYLVFDGDVAYTISLPTRLPLADYWLRYGEPATGHLDLLYQNSRQPFEAFHIMMFPGQHVMIDTSFDCPASPREYYQASMQFNWVSPRAPNPEAAYYDLYATGRFVYGSACSA